MVSNSEKSREWVSLKASFYFNFLNNNLFLSISYINVHMQHYSCLVLYFKFKNNHQQSTMTSSNQDINQNNPPEKSLLCRQTDLKYIEFNMFSCFM